MAQDTSAGEAANLSYNANIVLNTVRYAMIDQLTNPRPGFEEITRLHFRLALPLPQLLQSFRY